MAHSHRKDVRRELNQSIRKYREREYRELGVDPRRISRKYDIADFYEISMDIQSHPMDHKKLILTLNNYKYGKA